MAHATHAPTGAQDLDPHIHAAAAVNVLLSAAPAHAAAALLAHMDERTRERVLDLLDVWANGGHPEFGDPYWHDLPAWAQKRGLTTQNKVTRVRRQLEQPAPQGGSPARGAGSYIAAAAALAREAAAIPDHDLPIEAPRLARTLAGFAPAKTRRQVVGMCSALEDLDRVRARVCEGQAIAARSHTTSPHLSLVRGCA